MLNDQNVDLIIETFGYSEYDMIPTVNHFGGIWCLWNPINIRVSILAKESRAIHCHMKDIAKNKDTAKNKECILTIVYALAHE